MLTNITVNNEVDLYYQLNINKKHELKKNNIEIKYDHSLSDDETSINFDEYEKMVMEIYNDVDDETNNDKSNISTTDYMHDITNNCEIEYDEYIINNNNNNNKIYGHKNKFKKRILCDECGCDEIIEDTSHGILVCTNCGQVVSNLMDCGAEWVQYGDDNKKDMNRCSHPISQLLPQSSMASTITGACSSRIKKLHGWDTMPYKERSLSDVFKIIQAKCAELKILKCIEDDAKIMYKNIASCKHLECKKNKGGKQVIIRGRIRLGVIAACILFACRKKDKSRSSKEIAKSFKLKRTDITKGCKIFQEYAKTTNIELKLNSVKPEQFIVRFCEDLRIKKNYINQAIQIANNSQKLHIASVHTPISIATGSIYMMITLNELDIQKKKIAEQFNVSQVTISKAYKKLEPFTNLLTNDELCNRLSVEIKKYHDTIELNDSVKIKFIRFNIDIEKTFDQNKNLSTLFNILNIVNDECIINNELIVEHTIEIDNKLKQIENEFIKLNVNFTNDLYQMNKNYC